MGNLRLKDLDDLSKDPAIKKDYNDLFVHFLILLTMKKFQLLVLPFLFCYMSAFAQTESTKLNELTSFIEKGMADWEIPGLAVSVVKNGKTIYQKGFGLKNMHLKILIYMVWVGIYLTWWCGSRSSGGASGRGKYVLTTRGVSYLLVR
jgi:hypothetical protein